MKEIKNFKDFEKAFGKEKRNPKGISLDNIKNYLAFFKNPQKKLKTVQIAGTNGKGSTAAILQSILTCHNIKTGLFTSPHLIDYNERLIIDYKKIDRHKLITLLNEIFKRSKKHSLPLTLFEALTVAAIDYFIENKVDIAIFETGLGGRLDATNILSSRIQIITDISKDHTEFLGKTNKKIAQEKTGIIKSDSVVITSNTNQGILSEIQKKVNEKSAKLETIEEKDITDLNISKKGTIFSFKSSKTRFENLDLSLIGRHQAKNASLAIIALSSILETYYPNKKISQKSLKKGLKKTRWPGRFEIISHKPLVILDGAHNPAGVRALIKTLKDLKIKSPTVYFAAKKDKDVLEELEIISRISKDIYYVKTEIDNMFDPKNLSKEIPQLEIKSIVFENLVSKIKENKKRPFVITGSLYFIGLLQREFEKQKTTLPLLFF